MNTWVINLDSATDRWVAMQERLAVYGIEPNRWSATSDDGVERVWSGRPLPDQTRRRAIVNTYQRLLTHLATTDTDRWLILQDDVHLTTDPHRDDPGLIHVYGGWRILAHTMNEVGQWVSVPGTWHLGPTRRPSHVCPQAFSLHRDLLFELSVALQDETRQVCDLWLPLLTKHATFDEEPTIEPSHET